MFIFLNSFDRSGSTLLSHSLSQHPKIETLFNPFNSSVFRIKFMEYWDKSTVNSDTQIGKFLIEKILEGNFSKEIIKSNVFFKNSSTNKIIHDSLHIIKTTNFHLKLNWLSFEFSEIPNFALIRNPLGILASLVRNNFHKEWYGEWAFHDLKITLLQNNLFDREITEKIILISDEVEQMAAIVGVLNAHMLKSTPNPNIIKYEDILERPNEVLNDFISHFGLEYFDFSQYVNKSVNSSGKHFAGTELYLKLFSENQISRYTNIFEMCGNLGYKF